MPEFAEIPDQFSGDVLLPGLPESRGVGPVDYLQGPLGVSSIHKVSETDLYPCRVLRTQLK